MAETITSVILFELLLTNTNRVAMDMITTDSRKSGWRETDPFPPITIACELGLKLLTPEFQLIQLTFIGHFW